MGPPPMDTMSELKELMMCRFVSGVILIKC